MTKRQTKIKPLEYCECTSVIRLEVTWCAVADCLLESLRLDNLQRQTAGAAVYVELNMRQLSQAKTAVNL